MGSQDPELCYRHCLFSLRQSKATCRARVRRKEGIMEPPEECIVSSLAACVYWELDLDCERASMAMAAQWEVIDWGHLREGARRMGWLRSFRKLSEPLKPSERSYSKAKFMLALTATPSELAHHFPRDFAMSFILVCYEGRCSGKPLKSTLQAFIRKVVLAEKCGSSLK